MDDLGVLYPILGNFHLHHVGKCWHTPAALSFWRGQHRPVALDISFLAWWKHIGAPSTTCDIWHASTTWQVLSLGPKGVCKTSMQLATRPEPGGNKGWPNIPPKPTALIMFCAAPRELCLNPLNHGVFVTVSLYKDPLHQGGGRFTNTGAKATCATCDSLGRIMAQWYLFLPSFNESNTCCFQAASPIRWAARGRDDLLQMIKTYNPFLLILNVPKILKTGVHLQFQKISDWPI